MNSIDLPNGYERIKEIDFVRNRKENIAVSVFSVVSMILMLGLGVLLCGTGNLSELLLADSNEELYGLIIKCIVTIVMCLASAVVHEFIHGIFMKLFCKDCKLRFKFRFLYAYAASNAYFNKKSYNIIVAAPLVIIGIAAAVGCAFAPQGWFWAFYIVEIINVAGASGDIYVFTIISRMPKNILINDTGMKMTVYGYDDNLS